MGTTLPVTVAIPVGPHPANQRWFSEALESVQAQTFSPSEILVIDDGANLPPMEWLNIWKTPWLSGVAHAFNFGVALAQNEWVVMLGSDDRLMPNCLERAWSVWQTHHDLLGYYAFIVQYDNGLVQYDVPCNAAMVTKTLWRHTGGFPIEAAVGACDSFLLSLLLAGKGRFGTVYQVGSRSEPVYWYRQHPETDTALRGEMYWEMEKVRDIYLRRRLTT